MPPSWAPGFVSAPKCNSDRVTPLLSKTTREKLQRPDQDKTLHDPVCVSPTPQPPHLPHTPQDSPHCLSCNTPGPPAPPGLGTTCFSACSASPLISPRSLPSCHRASVSPSQRGTPDDIIQKSLPRPQSLAFMSLSYCESVNSWFPAHLRCVVVVCCCCI